MADLLNTRAGSERASRRKKRGEAAVDLIAGLGLIKKTKNEDGFLIQGNNLIPELKTALIVAPAGLITVFGTFDGMMIYESDYYAGAIFSGQGLKTYDYLLKQYSETGLGLNSRYSLLLQGQRESVILDVSPYSNMNTTQFFRNGSYYNTVPIGLLDGLSYQYPDSWPTAGVFPSIEESIWLSLAGTDLIYNATVNACTHHETTRIGHLSGNKILGGKTMFADQELSFWRPTAAALPLPVSEGFREVRPVTYMDYPFQEDSRYFGTVVEYVEGVLSYSRLDLSAIIHDPENIPPKHTGDVMPAGLRSILLDDPLCSCRPSGAFIAFSQPDEQPTVFIIIDLTATEQLKKPVSPPGDNSPDQDFFEDENNIEYRKWRISCHWYNLQTGETWSFTADQFWDLIRQRVRNLPIESDWRTASSSRVSYANWHAALAVLWQFFGRPQHNFQVPHDTWTFHAEGGDIYTWSRYYGNIKIDRAGIHGLTAEELLVPTVVTENDGIRPTIRYSGLFGDIDTGKHRYICVCEKLERFTPDEDLDQGQKEIYGIYVGTPFEEDGWLEVTPFLIESEDKTWSLVHVRIADHKFDEAAEEDRILLLGVARERYVNDEEEEIINYYSCFLEFNSSSGGSWGLAGKYPSLNTIDPVYGERFSVDLCLFGDNQLSPEMMKYPSPPAAMSQEPFGPYDGYYRGLP